MEYYQLLIVEDEDSGREGLANYIDWHSMGFQVSHTFRDGVEALHYIEQSEQPVHAILSDIRMPNMTGLELAQRLKAMDLDIYVVLLSAYKEFDYAREAVTLNVYDYILKPTEFSELQAVFLRLQATLNQDSGKEYSHPQEDGAIENAIAYMKKNFGQNCTLNDVAREVRLAPSYFSRLFKQNTGKTFSAYLTDIRVEEATYLLENTILKVHEISHSIGYDSPRHFSRTFKEKTGKLPTEYRTKMGENRL